MGQPTLEFNGTIGEASTGFGGPDKIEEDLRELAKMFDPNATLKSGAPGGINPDNMQPGTVSDETIGDITPDSGISEAFAGTGMLSKILSFLAKVVKSITGKSNWWTSAVTTIEDLHARVTTNLNSITTHKTSGDHDGRYYTESEINTKVSGLNSDISDNASAISTHKTSDDHDSRYYTETELNNGQLDSRYYTKATMDQRVSPTDGAIASVGGIANAGGNIAIEAGTGIEVVSDEANKKLRILATGEAIPAAHAEEHEAGGVDAIDPVALGAETPEGAMQKISAALAPVDNKVYLSTTIFTATNSGNTYMITIEPGRITSYMDLLGIPIKIKFNVDSTGAVSIKPNDLATKTLKKANGVSVVNVKANGIYTVVWSGVNFILQGEGGEYGNVTANKVLAGTLFGTEDGLEEGSIPLKSAAAITPGKTDQILAAGQYLSGAQKILSLGGDAPQSAVRADYTFSSNAAGRAKAGTMPNRGSQTTTLSITGSAKPTKSISAGYVAASTITAEVDSSQASHIESGYNLGGCVGTLPTGAVLKSIQRGSVVMTSTSKVVTITEVDLTKAFLVFSVEYDEEASSDDPAHYMTRGRITSSTQITFNRYDSDHDVQVFYEVIEFESGINVQSGTTLLDTKTNYQFVSISEVDMTKAFLMFTKSGNYSSGDGELQPLAGYIYNPTRLRFQNQRIYYGYYPTVDWQVIEFL